MKRNLVCLCIAALLAGCTTDPTDRTVVAPNAQTAVQTGKVVLLLADPSTGQVDPSLQKTLTYQGVDDKLNITFGPVTKPYAPEIEFNDVPVNTTGIEVYDSTNPDVVGEAEVQVRADRTTFATDVVLLPSRFALGNIRAKAGDPVAVGAGFIQTKTSTLGKPGSSPRMAAVDQSSVTASLKAPYKTNSWLSPVLWSDNQSPYYLVNKAFVNYQKAIYPKPWNIKHNLEGPNPGDNGIRFGPERVRSQGGAAIPNPLGFEAPFTSTRMAEIQSTFDVRPFEVKPGFLPQQMKVARIGDYDADFMLRGVDDPDFDKTGLPRSAALQMTTVRGNPILFFKTFSLPKVQLGAYFGDPNPTNQEGTVTLGNGVQAGYNVFTAEYPAYGKLTTVVFYHKQTASLKTTTNLDPATITFNNPADNNYFAVCLLPDAGSATGPNLQKLAAAAFSYPTNTLVTYDYNASAQTVDAKYKLEMADVLNTGSTSGVSGLLPNHYDSGPTGQPVLQGGPKDLGISFNTVRGSLKVYEGAEFTCRYLYSGILPFMPPLDPTDQAGKDKFAEWISVFIRRHGNDSPPYTAMNAEKGQQAYELGKFFGRNTLAASSIADVSPANNTLSAQIFDETRKGIELFFRENPSYTSGLKIPNDAAPYYLYYDPRVGAVNQYPNATGPSDIFPSDTETRPYDSYGAVTRGNDHHFHYGYYIFAAGQLGLRDPAWATQWKDAINQMIFDVADQSDVNPTPILKFPRMRNWDAYQNMCYAAGFSAPDSDGNNEESISEEMNFWSGVVLWGAATGQQKLMEHGIKHYAAASHTSWTYFFDKNGNTAALAAKTGLAGATNWPGDGAVRLFDGYTRWDTFFGLHPAFFRGIMMIPITGGSFYHALDNNHIAKVMKDYDDYVKQFNIDPLNPQGQAVFDGLNQWIEGPAHFYSIFARYVAMNDPANAVSRYWPVPSNYDSAGTKDPGGDPTKDKLIVPHDKFTDIGDSGVFTYHFIRFMETHGKADPSVKATNTPFYMTFLDAANRKRTYAAYNATGAALTVTFDDGESFSVPARSTGTKTVAF